MDSRGTPAAEWRGERGITRRAILSRAALLGAGAALDQVFVKGSSDRGTSGLAPVASNEVVPFYGRHQAGIATPAQEYLCFAAFDLVSGAVDDLRDVLEQWTVAAARLSGRDGYEPVKQELGRAPVDTGEAVGLGPSRLTLTVGFGPGLFGSPAADRFGLAHLRPPELEQLPVFRGESLDVESSGGDVCVQACADDPQVAFHAIHTLSRLAGRALALRWTQQGFGRTSSTSRSQSTPRNLMGFKDGTDNIRAEDTREMEDFVWVAGSDGPGWMTGGSYLIVRRIEILFDVWDATTLEDQQRTIGREKLSGAPLGSGAEDDPVNLQAVNASGELESPENAHIRLASPESNSGQRILRRGYSYCENVEPGSGEIDAGLFFIAFQRSPGRQFIPLQQRLAADDALNRHTLHTSSAIFACPPGTRPGGFLGDGLFS